MVGIFLKVIVILLAVAPVNAKQSEEKYNKNYEKRTFWNGETLGPWWMASSLKYESMPSPILYHLEASYGFSEATGSFDKNGHNANSSLTLRKNRFTYYLNYILDKQDQSIPSANMHLKYKTESVQTSLTFDITKSLYSSAGYVYSKDEKVFIDNESTLYCGLGYRVFDNPIYQLTVFSSTGRRYLQRMLEDETDDAGGLYLEDKLNFIISPTVNLWQHYMLLLNIENTDDYYWRLVAGADVKISDNFSFTASYNISYDQRPIPDVINDMMKIEKKNTMFNIGLKLIF